MTRLQSYIVVVCAGVAMSLSGCACGAECGNGRVEGDEGCDDDNGAGGDGCSAGCEVEPLFRCDNDIRPSFCTFTCGDGIFDSDTGEECDDGEANSDVVPDTCRPGCINPSCGDGVADPAFGEECDPPGSANCSMSCTLELIPDHGTCGMPVTVTPGTPVFATLAEGEMSEHEGSCRFVATPKMPFYGEAVFQLDLTEPSQLVISTDNPGTDMDTYLYVRGGDCAGGPELACNDDIDLGGMGSGNLFSEVSFPLAPPGTYYIFVDGSFDNTFGLRAFGNVELTVTATAVGDEGDPCDQMVGGTICAPHLMCSAATAVCENLMTPVCAAAAALPTGLSAGSTAAGSSEFRASCALGSDVSPEEVWTHTVPAGTGVVDVVVTATLAGMPPDYQPVVSIRGACDDPATELGCGVGPLGEATAVALAVDASAADVDLTIIVDGTPDTGGFGSGTYDVDVSYRPVLGSGTACDPAGVSDRCGAGLTCVDPGPGMDQCTPSGTCVTPEAVVGGVAAGSLSTGTGMLQGSCAPAGDYAESVYTVSTPVLQDLVVSTIHPGTVADTVVYVLENTCAGAELGCNDDSGPAGELSSELIIWDAVPGTDYLVVVDGTTKPDLSFLTGRDETGAYELTVTPRAIVPEAGACDPSETLNRCDWGTECLAGTCVITPAGNECAGAFIATSNVNASSVIVDTLSSGNDFAGSCGGSTGDDTVVFFNLPVTVSTLTISTDNPGTAHNDTVLYLRSPRCEAPPHEVACNDDIDAANMEFLSEIVLSPAPAGDYWLIVDSWTRSSAASWRSPSPPTDPTH